MHRETHHIKIRALHRCARHVSNPFLHAICSGFIHGTVFGHIVIDLLVRQGSECNLRAIDERLHFVSLLNECDGSKHCMRLTAQAMEHLYGLLLVMRFA